MIHKLPQITNTNFYKPVCVHLWIKTCPAFYTLKSIYENLPRTLQLEEEDHFLFVVDFGRQMSDTEIWEYAIQNDYIIITKDGDSFNL